MIVEKQVMDTFIKHEEEASAMIPAPTNIQYSKIIIKKPCLLSLATHQKNEDLWHSNYCFKMPVLDCLLYNNSN